MLVSVIGPPALLDAAPAVAEIAGDRGVGQPGRAGILQAAAVAAEAGAQGAVSQVAVPESSSPPPLWTAVMLPLIVQPAGWPCRHSPGRRHRCRWRSTEVQLV